MTTRKPISYEEFMRKIERSEETVQALSNPTLHGLKSAIKAADFTAELTPTAFGKGGKWDVPGKLQDIGVPDLRQKLFFGKAPEIEAKPEAVKAFSEFVSPTEGQERPSFGETFSTLVESQRERPLSEQLVTGIVDPIGTAATGGFGVAKGVGLATKAGSQLLRKTPAATKALKTVLTTPREGAISGLDEAIRAATKAENWEELLRLSAEQKRLGMPGVGEGVTGMSKRWAEDVYTPPGPIQVQEPLGSTPRWRGEATPQGPSPLWTQEVGPSYNRLWQEGAEQVPPGPIQVQEPLGSNPLWRGEATPQGASARWLEDVQEVPGVLRATPRWIDKVAYNTGLSRPAVDEVPINRYGQPDEGFRGSKEYQESLYLIKAGLNPFKTGGILDLGRYRAPFHVEAEAKARAAGWIEGNASRENMDIANRFSDEADELARKAGGLDDEKVPQSYFDTPTTAAVPQPESLFRTGYKPPTAIPPREGGFGLGFNRQTPQEIRDAAGRTVSSLGGEQPTATQRAIERTGGELPDTGKSALIPYSDAKPWTGTGIQPSDIGQELMPWREQVGGALSRGFGKAVDAILGGPGFKIEDRAGEIKSSWIEQFGDDSQKAVTFALKDVLKGARKLRRDEIERAQSVERTKRVGAGLGAASRVRGREEAYTAFKGQQAGEIPAARIDVADLREGLGEEGIESILNIVARAGVIEGETAARRTPLEKKLSPFESVNAYGAIKELLENGVVPTNSNITLLERIFGTGFSSELMKSRGGSKIPLLTQRTGYKPGELIADIINMPRANISSFDLSFLLRQGGMMFPAHAKEATAAFELAMKAIIPGGEDVARISRQMMMEVDNGKLWDKYVGRGGLFIHDMGSAGGLATREEAYLSTLAGKFFPWVRASERGYTTFLSKLRWDVMDDMVKKVEAAMGRELDPGNFDDLKILKSISAGINYKTGRGPMLSGGIWDGISAVMNGMMFSPRLFTSRLAAPVDALGQITNVHPIMAIKATVDQQPARAVLEELYPRAVGGDETARGAYRQMSRAVAKQMAAWFGTGTMFLGLMYSAKQSREDVDIGTDWRSSDFGKGRVGDTRIDVWSGYTQIARAIGQLIEGESKSAQTGQVRPISPIEVLQDFIRSKFAPSVGIVSDYNIFGIPGMGESVGKGTGFFGEDRDIIADMKKPPVRFSNNIPLVDEQSFWTQFMGPLMLRDLSDAIDEYMQPTLPNEVLSQVDETGKEPPGLVRQWAENIWDRAGGVGEVVEEVAGGAGVAAKSLAVGALATAGIGVTTFTTKDDMAEEFSRGLPGGPYKYLQLQPFEQDMIDEMAKAREEESGVTRTQGIGARLDASEANELQQYDNLAARASEMTVRDVRNEYYDIKNRFRIRRNQMLEDEFGTRDEEELQRLREQGMGPVRLRVEEFYTLQRKAEERKGDDLNYEEYESLLNDWENRMTQSGSPLGDTAVIMVRMNAHRTDLPEELLRRLSPQSQARYRAARDLREQYRRGELRSELYGQ